jgi:hypothetical protein
VGHGQRVCAGPPHPAGGLEQQLPAFGRNSNTGGEIASDVFTPFHADTPGGERFLQASFWSIPLFRADFLRFTSKIVEHSRYLPRVSLVVALLFLSY